MCEFIVPSVGAQQGWQCPVCGKVYAPWVSECTRCGGVLIGVATGKGDDATAINAMPNADGWVDVFRKCRKCGGDMQWAANIVLLSYPAKWVYRCKKCGNIEYETVGTAPPPNTITLNKGGKISEC